MKGLKLSQLFYKEAAKLIIEEVVGPEQYSAGLIGWSSEVLGLDDEHSRDHNWGPRFIVFLDAERYDDFGEYLDQFLREKLPHEFEGFPVNFGSSAMGDQRVMRAIEEGAVNHFIQIETLPNYLSHFLRIDPNRELSFEDWLQLSEHNLLGFTRGKVFHDGLGELGTWRSKLHYYPEKVWRFLLVKQWRCIAEEEAFVGRTSDREDTVGSLLIIGRIVERLMRLVFLMERTYAPYSKWFGSMFIQLKMGPRLAPYLTKALKAPMAKQREEALVQAYQLVGGLHNQLGITPAVENTISPAYKGRPGLVIHANRYADAIEQATNED